MKKILSFLSYHNVVPLAAVVLTMGAGITFAASQGLLPLPIPVASLPATDISAPESMDASALLAANLDTFDFHATVTGVVETDSLYTISYTVETLAPEGSEWTASSKTGEFSVAKETLGDGGLNAYVVGKLSDIENGERSYLIRAQTAEKALAETRRPRRSSAFAALVGLALDQILVPVVQKPAAPEQTSQTTTTDSASVGAPAAGASVATSTGSTGSPQAISATSTAVATGDATSTESSDMATATDVTSTATPKTDTTPPVITINGANQAHITVGDSYADLGASVTDNVDQNLGLKYFLNGALVSNIVIDTLGPCYGHDRLRRHRPSRQHQHVHSRRHRRIPRRRTCTDALIILQTRSYHGLFAKIKKRTRLGAGGIAPRAPGRRGQSAFAKLASIEDAQFNA